MKIVHITFNRNGGAAQAAWNIHIALLKSGINSWFFTLEPRFVEDPSLNWKCWRPKKLNFLQKTRTRLWRYYYDIIKVSRYFFLRKLAIEFDKLEGTFNGEIISLPISYVKILEDPIFENAQVIHLHWMTLMIDYGRFFALAKGRFKIIWTLHDLNPIMGLFNFEIDLNTNVQFTKLENKVKRFKLSCLKDYGNIIPVISPTDWMAGKLFDSDFKKYFKGYRINYCFNFEEWYVLSKLEMRDKYHYSTNQKIILSVAESSGVLRKKIDLVVDCAKDFPEIKFIFIGRNQANIQTPLNVEFTGFISDRKILNEYYALADCVIIPSIEDNLPNVLMESFASGRPVLAFRTGGMAEHINSNLNGILSYDSSLSGLEMIVRKFFTMIHSYRAMAIREYAEKHFFSESIVSQHITLYKLLVK